MTRSPVLTACIVFSLCAHFLLVHTKWTSTPTQGGEQILVPADFDVASLPAGDSLSLGQAAQPDSDSETGEKAQANRRRQVLRQYVTNVRKAIEQRKFQPDRHGLEDLIGKASYAFTIGPDSAFSDIRLTRTSGTPRLDRTALLAIRAASGVVERPKIIGSAPLHISVTVKYQYSL